MKRYMIISSLLALSFLIGAEENAVPEMSDEYLAQRAEILNKTFKILHIDSVVILQSPKLRAYIDQMRTNISNILDLKLNQVSIKATTTDFLGYIGRGEGLAAQSIVTIEDNRLWYLNQMLK